jgi:hypothetical protein
MPPDMRGYMKTTLDIADDLLARAKETARREKTTLRALVEEGLEHVLRQRQSPGKSKMKFITVTGNGLTPEFQNATWEQIRDEIYRGRGAYQLDLSKNQK